MCLFFENENFHYFSDFLSPPPLGLRFVLRMIAMISYLFDIQGRPVHLGGPFQKGPYIAKGIFLRLDRFKPDTLYLQLRNKSDTAANDAPASPPQTASKVAQEKIPLPARCLFSNCKTGHKPDPKTGLQNRTKAQMKLFG